MPQQHSQFEVIVNGRQVMTSAATLADLVTEHGSADLKVATALNGHFVPLQRRASTGLTVGDRIEIVSPRQGG